MIEDHQIPKKHKRQWIHIEPYVSWFNNQMIVPKSMAGHLKKKEVSITNQVKLLSPGQKINKKVLKVCPDYR